MYQSQNIDQVLSSDPSADVLVFENFSVHYKDWLTYSEGIDRLVELCYNLKQTVTLTLLLFCINFFF